MQRIRINSTIIYSVGYDADQDILEIEFESKEVYDYFHVPGGVYMGLMMASSQSLYFGERIKDRYDNRKVTG